MNCLFVREKVNIESFSQYHLDVWQINDVNNVDRGIPAAGG